MNKIKYLLLTITLNVALLDTSAQALTILEWCQDQIDPNRPDSMALMTQCLRGEYQVALIPVGVDWLGYGRNWRGAWRGSWIWGRGHRHGGFHGGRMDRDRDGGKRDFGGGKRDFGGGRDFGRDGRGKGGDHPGMGMGGDRGGDRGMKGSDRGGRGMGR